MPRKIDPTRVVREVLNWYASSDKDMEDGGATREDANQVYLGLLGQILEEAQSDGLRTISGNRGYYAWKCNDRGEPIENSKKLFYKPKPDYYEPL